MRLNPTATFVLALLVLCASPTPPLAQELLYGTEGNRLRRYDVDTIGSARLIQEIHVERAGGSPETSPGGVDAVHGRDVNGQICFFPDGSGRFIAGEDSGQPTPPAGWGIFDALGVQIGKLTPTYKIPNPEPHGCAFNSQGVLFTSSVGEQGFLLGGGQLLQWFPPYQGYPGAAGTYPNNLASSNFCKLATDISTAASVVIDANDNVYVASSGGGAVLKFAPPFPTARGPAGGCSSGLGTDAPMADFIQRSTLIGPSPGNKLFTYSGLALSPQGTLYVASVLTGRIGEYDLNGNLLRFIVDHNVPITALPTPFGNPQGLTVGADGTLYYADLDLVGVLPNVGPGPNGKVWRVRFDANGDPLAPEIVREGLAFPDGVAIAPGNLQQTEWLTYAGGPERQFFNPDETRITPANVGGIAIRWVFPTSAVITGSPTVAAVDLPGEGLRQVAYFQSWNRRIYAVRVIDGSEVWRFQMDIQPGAAFENAGSAHVERVGDRDVVFIGGGETMYALDAVSGEERWRFIAGTGCVDDQGQPPGSCAFDDERNQIESSPIVVNDTLVFGMDVNDVPTGKGGFYGVNVLDGTMKWYFDPQSGQTCRTNGGDAIGQFDGYHTESELGLPAGFLATRAGCDFPRDAYGCSNIWSSPAVDTGRQLLFSASSNCDTPIDPGTGQPETMPPFDEAIFALDFDGNAVWRWRPRDFDNEDLAFGAVPNLFTINVMVAGQPTDVDVVGVGNKDGTYYVLDRTGTNQQTGASWDDDPATHLPADLPYWRTNVVPGGDIGGIIATAAVDEGARRIYFSTAPGTSAQNSPPDGPQTPIVHALDMDTGAIVWQVTGGNLPLASFGPTSAIPGVVFVGQTPAAFARAYETAGDSGAQLANFYLNNLSGNASGAVVIDGTVLMGEGVGTRSQTGSSPGDFAADTPSQMHALCVAGSVGCGACNDGVDNDNDGAMDFPADNGCVGRSDASEVRGDLDYDADVDEADRQTFFGAFGRRIGNPGFVNAADFDRDGIVGLADYQQWRQSLVAFQAGCGLLGIEPVLLIAGLRFAQRRRRAGRAAAARSTEEGRSRNHGCP